MVKYRVRHLPDEIYGYTRSFDSLDEMIEYMYDSGLDHLPFKFSKQVTYSEVPIQ